VIISSEQRSTSSLEFSELLHPLSIIACSYAGCKPTETRFKRNGKPRMATENAESPLECDPARLESQTGTSYLERGSAVCAGHRGSCGDDDSIGTRMHTRHVYTRRIPHAHYAIVFAATRSSVQWWTVAIGAIKGTHGGKLSRPMLPSPLHRRNNGRGEMP